MSCPYRAVDSEGNTLDFLLTARRDAEATQRFFIKVLKATHTQKPRVISMAITDAEASSACLAINVDKNPSYPPAIEQLKNYYRFASKGPTQTDQLLE